jgi:hypothetical protein
MKWRARSPKKEVCQAGATAESVFSVLMAFEGIVMLLKLARLANVSPPICVTLPGIVTPARLSGKATAR